MYRGFKLPQGFDKKEYFVKGQELYESNKKKVQNKINSFIAVDGSIDAVKMQEDWFPLINADVFISHSHNDEKTAIAFAGWLFEKFGIAAFVDSCIWGNANDLLEKLDTRYSWTDDKRESYNYTKVKNSTSHVHMMLITALSKMIDKTECLFFLKTPNAIIPSQVKDQTLSPWIYYEIAMTQLIRQHIPERRKIDASKLFSGGRVSILEKKELKMKFDLDLSYLTDLDNNTVDQWGKTKHSGEHKALDALDELYALKPIDIINI